MHLEIWQFILLIVVCGVWSEYRFLDGKKRAYQEATKDVDEMIEASISRAKFKYMMLLSKQIIDALLKSGLIVRAGNGVYIGKDDRVFDIHAELEKEPS
jgi:hypothetical protein